MENCWALEIEPEKRKLFVICVQKLAKLCYLHSAESDQTLELDVCTDT